MSSKLIHLAAVAVVGVVLGMAAATAAAKRPESLVHVAPATTPEAFAKQAAEVRASMRGNGRYSGISTADRGQVEEDIATIEELLGARGSLENLTGREEVELINAQEEANALLTENDGDRLICRYEKKTGTHFREKYCITASEQARQRNENQTAFRNLPSRVFQDTGEGVRPVGTGSNNIP
jgi:hypothetical protein